MIGGMPRSVWRGARTPVITVSQSTRRLLAVGAGAFILCLVAYVFFVLTPSGQLVAELILYGRRAGGSRAGDLATGTLDTISLATVTAATLALAGAAVVFDRRRVAVAVVVAIVGANLTTQVFKRMLERPNLIGEAAQAAGNSFPSGHVTIAASLVLAALLVVPRPLRSPVAVVGAAYVGAIAMSTLAAGWHRLGDSIGAILIALAWTSFAAAALARWSFMPRRSWRFGSARPTASLLALVGFIAVMLGAALLGITWIDPQLRAGSLESADDARRAFVAGLAVIGGIALIASASLLWALRGVALDRA